MIKKVKVDELEVYIHDNRVEMGQNGAELASKVIKELLSEQDEVNIIFASSPSQNDILKSLSKEHGIDWKRVNAFHMDEFIGVDSNQPASFANFLKEGFFSEVKFKEIFYIDGLAEADEECRRYANHILEHPTDICFLGIGENGHIAFNDPHIANFFDPDLVITNNELDETCRQQQVADNWFKNINDVPRGAVTVSVYGLLRAPYIFATVPGERKAAIVKKCLEYPINKQCPSTGIRLHKNAKLFLDADSSALLSI